MILGLNVDLGTVPDWVTAAATVIGFAVALWILLRFQLDKEKRDRWDRALDRAKVVAIHRDKDPHGRDMLYVDNRSDVPLSEPWVIWYAPDPSGSTSFHSALMAPDANEAIPAYSDVPWCRADEQPDGAVALFGWRDADGYRWQVTSDRRLMAAIRWTLEDGNQIPLYPPRHGVRVGDYL